MHSSLGLEWPGLCGRSRSLVVGVLAVVICAVGFVVIQLVNRSAPGPQCGWLAGVYYFGGFATVFLRGGSTATSGTNPLFGTWQG
jgi:hypothetical protein